MRRTAKDSNDSGAVLAAPLEIESETGQALDTQTKKKQDSLPTQVRRAAMDALARREHSYAELARKLETKFLDTEQQARRAAFRKEYESRRSAGDDLEDDSSAESPRRLSRKRREQSLVEPAQPAQPAVSKALIDEQLSRLREQGLQSDARFSEAYVRYRKTRGFGYLHIRADLLSRGVSETLIEETLFEEDEDWLLMAEDLAEKKLRGERDLAFGGKAHRRLTRFLESRGFPSHAIRRALDARFLR